MRLTLTGALGGSFATRLAGAGAAFAMHAMLARLAGAEQYGTYSYVAAWIGVLSRPASTCSSSERCSAWRRLASRQS